VRWLGVGLLGRLLLREEQDGADGFVGAEHCCLWDRLSIPKFNKKVTPEIWCDFRALHEWDDAFGVDVSSYRSIWKWHLHV